MKFHHWDPQKFMKRQRHSAEISQSHASLLLSSNLDFVSPIKNSSTCKSRKNIFTKNIVSNRLNLTFEPCYCLTQHVIRSYHKCMRAQVTWKVLYDRIAILKYICVWLSRFCSLSVRLPSFHRSPKVSDCCLKTYKTYRKLSFDRQLSLWLTPLKKQLTKFKFT